MEKILRIEEFSNVEPRSETNPWGGYDGYRIVTTEQVITVAINNDQRCCESWGYLSSEDELRRFVGANLLGVSLTDTALVSYELPKDDENTTTEAVFVNIETSVGVLQLVVYNNQNGYYGHKVRVVSNTLRHEDTL